MEENNAQQFVDQQLGFNKDVIKASEGMLEGLRQQSKINQAISQELLDQQNQLKTHRQLITGLTIGYFASTIGLIIWMMA